MSKCDVRSGLEVKPGESLVGVPAPAATFSGVPSVGRRRLLALIGAGAAGGVLGTPGLALASSPAAVASGTAPSGFTGSLALARSLVQTALKDTETPSISMALMSSSGLVWAEAQGTFGDTAKTPVTNDTLYCIGSCSKLLATVATMQLVDQGLVNLDEPLVQYLPSFSMRSPEYRSITVRMLLNHQSGFPGSDYSNGFTTLPFPGYSRQVLNTLSQAFLKHRPGEMSVYCNDGFTVIEELIEAMTGVAYTDYVRRNILDPLGMTKSRYAVELFPEGSFAPGRDTKGRTFLECINVYGSGGLYTTPSEMAAFARVFLNKGKVGELTILSEASVQAMAELQTLRESLRPVPIDWGYGLGWDDVHQGAFAVRGVRAWRKNGGTTVFSSDFYVLPDHDLAFLVTGNGLGYGSDAIAEQVLYEALIEKGAVSQRPPEVTLAPAATLSPYGAAADAMIGIYANYQSIYRLSRPVSSGRLPVEKWEKGQWTEHALWTQRADGLWGDPETPSTAFGLARTGSDRYLTLHRPLGAGFNQLDLAFLQSFTPGQALPKAWSERVNRTWVVINEHYTSLSLAEGGAALRLSAVPGLEGYLAVDSGPSSTDNQIVRVQDDVTALMCMKLPYVMSRDLNSLHVERTDGQEMLRFGRAVFKPLDAAAVISQGETLEFVGHGAGHATVVRVSQAVTLSLKGVLAAFVYDAQLGPAFPDVFRANRDGVLESAVDDSVKVPEGGILLVYGAQGSAVSLKALPSG